MAPIARFLRLTLPSLALVAQTGCIGVYQNPLDLDPGGSSNEAHDPECLADPAIGDDAGYSAVGSGTALDPYLICTASQLASIGADPASWTLSFKLIEDIELAPYYAAGGAEFQIGSCGSGTCGDADASEGDFDGTFDGGGYAIRGFRFVAPARDSVGLFGRGSGTVRDLTIASATVEGDSGVGIAAGDWSGTMTGVHTSGTASGTDSVGGLIGAANTPVDGCSSSATATGQSTWTGGLIGIAMDYVSNSFATGDVTGASNAGGLVGYSDYGIEDSYATGDVTGTTYVGGLVGLDGGGIDKCHATGTVTATGSGSGGLAGRATSVRYSYATGTVNGQDNTGGLVGVMDGTISDSYATNQVTGALQVGGLAGNLGTRVIRNCYATGAVSGDGQVGGLFGHATVGNVNNAFAIGSVASTGSSDLLGVGNGAFTEAWVWSGASCSGTCGANATSSTATLSDFYDTTLALYTNGFAWDFAATWTANAGALPTLQ